MNSPLRNSGRGVAHFLSDGDLKVMAWDALVKRGALDLSVAPCSGIGCVHEERPRARSIVSRREVERNCPVRCLSHDAVAYRESAEPVAHLCPRTFERHLADFDDFGSRCMRNALVCTQDGEYLVQIRGAKRIGAEFPVLVSKSSYLFKADLMNLASLHRERGVSLDQS